LEDLGLQFYGQVDEVWSGEYSFHG
jgi:hypothetical protein